MNKTDDLIKVRWQAISENIATAMAKRNLDLPLKVVAVTKRHSLSELIPLASCGLLSWGENHAQELVFKQQQFKTDGYDFSVDWQFIGSLQKNKLKYVVGKVSLIHSVDSWALLNAINDYATKIAIVSGNNDFRQNILLQVNYSAEPTKHGFSIAEIKALPNHLSQNAFLQHIRICGLMTMAPKLAPQSQLQTIFTGVRDLLTEWQSLDAKSLGGTEFWQPQELSMGMSDDFLTAIASGATIIRLGRALLDFPL